MEEGADKQGLAMEKEEGVDKRGLAYIWRMEEGGGA